MAFDDIHAAIAREKQLKGWNRAWKIRLIEKNNQNRDDLYPVLTAAFSRRGRCDFLGGGVYWVPFPRPALGRSRRG